MENQNPTDKINFYDKHEGFFYENRHDLINIYQKCLKRINQKELFDYERLCIENYSKMLKEAKGIVKNQLLNEF